MSMSTLPRAVGPLTLLRKLETDTVSEIFQGTLDTLEGRPVLVRRMLPHVLRDPTRLRAIESRARDLMKVDDERLLRTFHWVVEGIERYLVEDMPAGVGLDSLITWCRFAERPLPPHLFLAIAYRICDALEALHAHRAADGSPLLHMGMSPSSVTLHPGGRVALGLYALARAPAAVPVDVPSTTLNYRSQYLSPEQTHPDRPLEPASDVFSTGAILYELLMLEPLSSGDNSVETVHAIRRGEHGAQLAAAADRVPAIDAVLDRALALNPTARYRDAAALRDDVRILLGGGTGEVDALDDFLAPLFAGISETSRPSAVVPFLEEDPDRTAGDAIVTWSTTGAIPPKDDDDDTLVRERPADPAGYSREFASAVDPTDAPDLFDEPTGEILVEPTITDVGGDAADTQFYRIPSPPPEPPTPEPRPRAAVPPAPPRPEEPPPLWTEESTQRQRSPLRLAGWIGAVAAIVVCAGIGYGATKMLTGTKPAPAPTETAVATKPPPAPVVVAPPPEEPPPVVAPEPREAEVARPAQPPREPRVVADVEPPAIHEEREPPRVEPRPPVVEDERPPIEPEEPPLPHETEPQAIPDEDLFADLSTSRKPIAEDLVPTETDLSPAEKGPIARIDIDGMKPSARNGELSNADVLALEGVAASDPAYTRSRALLLMNAQKGKDPKAIKRYLDDLMRLPENRYDPIFLTELARYYVGSGKYQQAVDQAKTAEQHWARLPSDLVYVKKAEMYEIQARGYTGIFFESESVEALDQAIRCWEKYRAHVATRASDPLVAMADKELVKLRTYRERME
jgi:eukaryotic-like serine/threonine-protein kinase